MQAVKSVYDASKLLVVPELSKEDVSMSFAVYSKCCDVNYRHFCNKFPFVIITLFFLGLRLIKVLTTPLQSKIHLLRVF